MRHPLLHMILLAMGCTDRFAGEACIGWEFDPNEGAECPHPRDVAFDDLWPRLSSCDPPASVVKMVSTEPPEPNVSTSDVACCYEVELVSTSSEPSDPDCGQTIQGRPYVDGHVVLAPASEASVWSNIARAEHASVAAFAKLTLQLMAHGADPELLAEVARAAADEVRHTSIALELASTFGGQVTLGPFPFPGPVDPRVPLVDLATAAVREGCIGETLSALAFRRAAEIAEDPAVAARLAEIATDEDRHAALSWRIAAWAIRVGGDEVHSAVAAVFREPVRAPHFGLLEPHELEAVASKALREVVAPAARVLLG